MAPTYPDPRGALTMGSPPAPTFVLFPPPTATFVFTPTPFSLDVLMFLEQLKLLPGLGPLNESSPLP